MGTTAIFVTYGSRLEIARKSVSAILDDPVVERVVVVDNGSKPAFSLSDPRSHRVRIVRNSENQGSAGGFDDGIRVALDSPECTHLALFDDDNVIDSGNMKAVIDLYSSLGSVKVAISILRISRPDYRKFLDGMIPKLLPEDGFLGFSISSKVQRSARRAVRILSGSSDSARVRSIDVAPYGGLFFSRDELSAIGGPNRALYLYGDDHDFTRRMVQSGVTIYLSDVATINDIDESWDLGKSETNPWIDRSLPEWRRYFAARNRLILESQLRKTVWSTINRWMFICWLWIRAAASYKSVSLVRSAMRPLYEGLSDARSHPVYRFECRYRPSGQSCGK